MEDTNKESGTNSKTCSKTIAQLLCEIERRVRIIRSARIEAAKRNKRKDNFYKTILIVYTIIITVLSVRFGVEQLDGTEESNLSINLLASSVYLTLMTMYISQKNYAEKVSKYQSNYMELTRLHSEIQAIIVLNQSDEENMVYYKDFTNRYASLLTQSDNHEDIDYHRAVVREEKEKVIKCKESEAKINKYKILEFLKRVIVVISLPLLFVIITLVDNLK